MSGGSYDYAYLTILRLAEGIKLDSDAPNAAPPALRTRFRELLLRVAAACRAVEWNDSGDGASEEATLLHQLLGPLTETEEIELRKGMATSASSGIGSKRS